MEAYNINVVQQVNTVDQQNVRHELKLYGTVVNLSADYVEAIREIQQVRDEAIAAVNQTRDEALEEFNTNASEKQEEYNTNAAEKQGAYNNNAAEKFGEYNNNAAAKLEEYNANAAEKQAQVDNSAELARQWAVKMDGKVADEDYSSKYYADQAQTSANLANIQNKITNCLLEVPQNIKLDLSDGTLTIKAGSKLFCPNGVGVFDELILNSDHTMKPTTNSGQYLLYVNATGSNSLGWRPVSSCYSGTDDTGSGTTFYNTSTNIITAHNSGGDARVSLPFALVTLSSVGVASIDQVFNGLGLIGSTAFVLPGVKGLAPNGRNEDGSLNSTECVSVKCQIYNFSDTNNTRVLCFTGNNLDIMSAGLTVVKTRSEGLSAFTYIEDENIIVSNVSPYVPQVRCALARINTDNGRITYFAPKTSFHAVDFNDFYEADSQNVKLIGNQVVKGVKTFCQSGGAQQQHVLIRNDEMTNSAPAQEQWVGIAMTDVRGSWKTALRHGLYTDGRSQSVWLSKSLDDTYTSTIYHGWNPSGAWISNIVVTDNNRSQTISGRKTFNGSGIGIIKSGSAIDIQNTAVDLTSTSISGTTEIHFVDKNNKVQAIFQHQNTTSGQSVAIMAARNHANNGWVTVNAGFNANDVAYTATATPPANSNGSNIATTSWVRNYSKNYGAQLNYSGAITITGTGTKTASVSGVLIMTGKGSSAVGQFKITIGGQTFNCAQGYNGTDYFHATFAYFPVESGQSYTIEEISASCDLRLIPYK